MVVGSVRRRLGRRWSRAAALVAACCAAAVLAGLRPAPDLLTQAEFPGVRPAAVAHLLADYSSHPLTQRGTWSVEKEWSNYTSWQYIVSYDCGARCSGRATVEAHDPHHDPRAGAHAGSHAGAHASDGGEHRVRVVHAHCTRLPLLPWPQLCGETDTETVVRGGGAEGGARVSERARSRCVGAAAALAALAGACGDQRLLRAQRHLHLQHLRRALAATAPHPPL
ncbi:uncharacterized protein LOC131850641 [Achroia grisella]|uniref:uncharacterized protein LOC131850641 n=1 Tax=Achroia grisella TaxID=688607 RepID=UPI0027D1F563|nr:uncharacterized protein LOC131850641 [Achroia grisella]